MERGSRAPFVLYGATEDMRIIHSIFALGLMSICTAATGMENIFYILRSHQPSQITASQHAFASLSKNYKAINLLITQAYTLDDHGLLWGFVDADTFNFTRSHGMKLMALVTNTRFDKVIVHRFLASPAAQEQAIASILAAARQNHFYGVQMDLEMVNVTDRDALTRFYQNTAAALHKNGYIVSFAVAPLTSNPPFASEYEKKLYVNWEGAYDIKALGQSADFLTIMAYNQHAQGTTPGPSAAIHWVEAAVQYALQYVPAEKISLGIPAYSTYWFAGTDPEDAYGKISVHMAGIGHDKAMYLLRKYNAKLRPDENSRVNFAMYEHDSLNEYLFVEDADSVQAKLDLAKKYRLRGISVFSLGSEDPAIWSRLSS